jgi:hypothetical protein
VQIDTEVIYVGTISGNVFESCVRGYALTSATTHAQTAQVKAYIFSYHHNQICAEVKAIEAALGVNLGNVVTQTDTAGGDLMNNWSTLALVPTGVTAGTYGGFNVNVQLHVRADGRIDTIENAIGNRNYPIIYKAAIIQGSNAVLGFSFPETGGPYAPAAFVYDGSNTYIGLAGETGSPNPGSGGSLYAIARFTQSQNQWVQDHFYLPDDWVGDTISLDIYWRTSVTTGNVIWQVQVGSLRAGLSPDVTLNTLVGVTTTVPGTAYQTVKSRITPLNMSGINAGDELFFKFMRANSDTAGAGADLVSIKFNINRDFSLYQ